jgi:hypothetical protein
VGLSLWGTFILGLVSATPWPVYDHVLEFLKRNHARKLREVMDAEIDISDVIQ